MRRGYSKGDRKRTHRSEERRQAEAWYQMIQQERERKARFAGGLDNRPADLQQELTSWQ